MKQQRIGAVAIFGGSWRQQRKKIMSGSSILRKSSAYQWFGRAILLAALVWGTETALAGSFVEPPVFASDDGVLGLLMIAKPAPVPSILFTPPSGPPGIHPIGWVYEICRRPESGNQCPRGSATIANYGGVR